MASLLRPTFSRLSLPSARYLIHQTPLPDSFSQTPVAFAVGLRGMLSLLRKMYQSIPISITSTRRHEKASLVERLWSLQPIHFRYVILVPGGGVEPPRG